MRILLMSIWLLALPALADQATDRFLKIMTLVHSADLKDADAKAIVEEFEAAQKALIAESSDAICSQRRYYSYASDALASALEVLDVRIDGLMTHALNKLESELAKKPKAMAAVNTLVDSSFIEVRNHPDNYDYIRAGGNDNTQLVSRMCDHEAWDAWARAEADRRNAEARNGEQGEPR
jgi:hypothetical protein